jgi:hypothetical protein
MADQEKVTERARAIYKSNDPRLAQFEGQATAAWNESVRLAAEEIGLEEAAARAAAPKPEPVPEETPEESDEPEGWPAWTKAAAAFALGLALGACAVWIGSSPVTANDLPAQYRPAFVRMTNEIRRAELRFEAAKACHDLRSASSKDACEIK